jgi:DNA-binding transcriptional ArsR family regulator
MAEAAMKAFGMNQVRAAIIRHLAQKPNGATSGDISRQLQATYQTVFRHLQDLEEQGIVASDAGEQRQGQRVRYTLNKQARDKALADYAHYLDGQ